MGAASQPGRYDSDAPQDSFFCLIYPGQRCLHEWRVDAHAFLSFYCYAEANQIVESLHFVLCVQEYAPIPLRAMFCLF